MKTLERKQTFKNETMIAILESFKINAVKNDIEGFFVDENYRILKKHKLFSALVPVELGGMGMAFAEMCDLIREIGQVCGSTGLAFSMHQHLVAAAVWKYKHKNIGEMTLRKIVEEQPILVSTGARDWLGSNGNLERTEGGYLFSAKKFFASQSIAGDIAITSAPYEDEIVNGKFFIFQFL